jgi:hypothetical protein
MAKGGSEVRTPTKPQGKRPTYVAPQSDKDWLLIEQRKLYARSMENLDYVFCKLWGLVTDPRNLRIALARATRNPGSRTSGVDRITTRKVISDGWTHLSPTRARNFDPAPTGPVRSDEC